MSQSLAIMPENMAIPKPSILVGIMDMKHLDGNEHQPLGLANCGFSGVIAHIDARALQSSLGQDEIERRLIELGFVEGARVDILHEGLFGRDPIAVRVDSSKVALRRHEAMAIFVAGPSK